MSQSSTIPTQSVNPITSINPETLVEHGESPTAIILAITILIIFLFRGLTELIQVILKQRK